MVWSVYMMSHLRVQCYNKPRLCPSSWIATRRRQAATWASLNAPALTPSVTCSTRADESRNTTDGLVVEPAQASSVDVSGGTSGGGVVSHCTITSAALESATWIARSSPYRNCAFQAATLLATSAGIAARGSA